MSINFDCNENGKVNGIQYNCNGFYLELTLPKDVELNNNDIFCQIAFALTLAKEINERATKIENIKKAKENE